MSSGTTHLTSPTRILMKIGLHVGHGDRKKRVKRVFFLPWVNYFLRYDLSKFLPFHMTLVI